MALDNIIGKELARLLDEAKRLGDGRLVLGDGTTMWPHEYSVLANRLAGQRRGERWDP